MLGKLALLPLSTLLTLLVYEAAARLELHQSRPDFQLAHRALAATYAQLGRMEEARMALQEDLRLAPDESVSLIKAQVPYTDPDFLERYTDALRKAGLPEPPLGQTPASPRHTLLRTHRHRDLTLAGLASGRLCLCARNCRLKQICAGYRAEASSSMTSAGPP